MDGSGKPERGAGVWGCGGGWGWGGGRDSLGRDATLTSQEGGAAGFQAPSGRTHCCPSASSSTLEEISKIRTLMSEIIVFLELKVDGE